MNKIFQLIPEFLQLALNEHAIVSIADANGDIVFVNDKFCSISGYSESELLGKNHRVVKSGYHSKKFYKELWDCITRGQPWSGEIQNRTKQGEVYWVKSTIVPITDKNGAITHYFSIHTDITDTKNELEIRAQRLEHETVYNQQLIEALENTNQLHEETRLQALEIEAAKDKLQQAKHKLELILRHSTQGITLIDLETDKHHVIKGTTELLERFKNLTYSDFVRKVHSSQEVVRLKLAREHPGTQVLAATRDPDTGEVLRWNQFIFSKPFKEEARLVQYVYRENVDELIRTQEMLQSALKISDMSIFRVDVETGRGEFIFQTGDDSFEHSEQWLKRVSPEYVSMVANNQLGAEPRDIEYEVYLNGEKNPPTWIFETVIDQFTDDIGRTKRLILSRNIHKSKMAELELRHKNAELEKVTDNNRRMFAVLGHEIKTPLLAASMLLSSEAEAEAEAAHLKALALTNVNHGLQLVEELRGIIRPEALTKSKSLETLSLGYLIGSIVDTQRAMLTNETRLHLSITPDADSKFTLNTTAVRQVLLNLLRNSCIHANPNNIWVKVEQREIPNSDETLLIRVTVEDDGPGVRLDKQGQLFDAFYQGERGNQGTGIGLFVCKDVAISLGGDLIYADRIGGGAQFNFTFIVSIPDINSDETEGHLASDTSCVAGLRILFAEDTAVLRMVTSKVLSNAGAIVTTANDGAHAAELFELDARFDLVVTDLQMPHLDGEGLMTELTQRGYKGPIIALTALTNESDIQRLLKDGFSAVLEKPLRLDQLPPQIVRKGLQTSI